MADGSSSDDRETVTDQDLLDALRQTESPVIATGEIAENEEIPISQGQVLKRLKSLEEKGRVGSKSYSAKPQVRLWWDKRVEMKETWASGNGISEEIGVEAVDALDLPGRGEKLRKRREAVNSVFKFLFDVEKASKRELSLVGWGADMETYADQHSLWNNCLKKALDQSPFYLLEESEKNWTLSTLGSFLKEIDNRALWENWDNNTTKIEKHYHRIVWCSIFDASIEFRLADEDNFSTVQRKYGESGPIIGHTLHMDGPVWFTSTGSFGMILEIRKEPEELKTIRDNIDYLTANLEREFHIRDFIDEQSILQLKCSHQLDIEASTMLRQLEEESFNHRNLIHQLKRLSEWEKETRAQLIEVDERINQMSN
jgi:hypothetical protein